MCTTNIIADTVNTIVGDKAHVLSLMGPGIDPHVYRARESDLHKLIAADIIFYNGLHLEGKMAEILARMPPPVHSVAVSDGIPRNKLLSSPECATIYDPHIWFDVTLWIHVVDTITQTLITYDSHNAKYYKNNAQKYQKELQSLHTYVQKHAQKLSQKQRILVTAHDAFSYFGRAYGFQVVGLQGISTDAEPGIHDIQELANFIISHKIPAIFTESSVSQRAITAVQHATRARGWQVSIGDELFSDSLGTPETGASTYTSMIRYTINTLTKSLQFEN